MCVNRRSKLEQASNDKAALRALMDLVLAVVDVLEAPTATQRAKARGRMVAERREVEGWRERDCGSLELATRQARAGAVVSDGLEAKAAVEATVRRWEAYRERYRQTVTDPPLEADDSRVTDEHSCCGGKPDCGCRSVGG